MISSDEFERMAKQSHLASLERRLKQHERKARLKFLFADIAWMFAIIAAFALLMMLFLLLTPSW